MPGKRKDPTTFPLAGSYHLGADKYQWVVYEKLKSRFKPRSYHPRLQQALEWTIDALLREGVVGGAVENLQQALEGTREAAQALQRAIELTAGLDRFRTLLRPARASKQCETREN